MCVCQSQHEQYPYIGEYDLKLNKKYPENLRSQLRHINLTTQYIIDDPQ